MRDDQRTNPCGEQPLPPHGACLLGSINLARLIDKPFTPDAALDEARLEALTATAVRFLDNAIDVSNYPLPAQRQEAKAKRRIGLGVTGLADALILCGVRYGTPEAVALAERWMAAIETAAYRASAELAREKGAFPLFDAEKFLAAPNVQRLPEDVRAAIARARHPQRPPHLHRADRHHLAAGRQRVERHRAGVRLPLRAARAGARRLDAHRRRWRTTPTRSTASASAPTAPLPEAFVRAEELAPRAHLEMQAALQRARRQLDLQDHQLPGRHRASRPSRTSTSTPTRWASRAAPPSAPTPSPARC